MVEQATPILQGGGVGCEGGAGHSHPAWGGVGCEGGAGHSHPAWGGVGCEGWSRPPPSCMGVE